MSLSKRAKQYAEYDGSHIEQITEEDVRFYKDNLIKNYVPSVTTYLDVLPNIQLDIWRDKVGAEAADKVANEAAKSGTKVHNVIEQISIDLLDKGYSEYSWLDEFGNKTLTAYEWEMVLKFVDFYENFVDSIISTEQKLISQTLFVAGTVDLLCTLKDGRTALIDHKTSNNLSDKFSVQTWVYKQMVEELYDTTIDVRGVLWLKASTRGRDKNNKNIQGKGWKLVEHVEDDRDETIFSCAKTLFLDLYRKGELQPKINQYPSKVILKVN
jgi:hypothetical protein